MNYQLIRTNRRSLSLEVNNKEELIVRAPLMMPLIQIEQFIRAKQRWINNKQYQVSQRQAQQKTYNAGDLHSYLGKKYPLVFGNNIVFDGINLVLKNTKNAKSELLILYKNAFKEIALPRLNYYARQLNLRYNQVRIKAQKSRWGSCSACDNINLNYLLIQAPIEVIDYVLVHELCHLKYKDHSSNFYQLIATIIPNYKQQVRYLKTKNYELRNL